MEVCGFRAHISAVVLGLDLGVFNNLKWLYVSMTATTSERGRNFSVSSPFKGLPLPVLNKTKFILRVSVLRSTYSGIVLWKRLLEARSRALLEYQIVARPIIKLRCFYQTRNYITGFIRDNFIEIT
jgi:hypothetical protein